VDAHSQITFGESNFFKISYLGGGWRHAQRSEEAVLGWLGIWSGDSSSRQLGAPEADVRVPGEPGDRRGGGSGRGVGRWGRTTAGVE
jgi:hypothetical protein